MMSVRLHAIDFNSWVMVVAQGFPRYVSDHHLFESSKSVDGVNVD